MQSATRAGLACALALVLAANRGYAQTLVEDAPASTEEALHTMEQQAAVIFAGQVIAVRRLSGASGATGVVEIEFAVDDAVRGVSGNTYTLREWAGMWAAGDQPLRAGQHYLMLLHAPSAAGLSSPVGGMDGAIPIRGGAEEPAVQARAASAPVDARMVDLRWIATRAVRRISYVAAVHPTALPVGVHAEAIAAAPTPNTEATIDLQTCAAVSPAATMIAPAARDAGYATVLTLLRSWVKSGDAAR